MTLPGGLVYVYALAPTIQTTHETSERSTSYALGPCHSRVFACCASRFGDLRIPRCVFRLSMNCPTHPSPVGHRQYVLAPWSESTSSGAVWGSVIEDHALGSGLLFLANSFGHFRICQNRRGMSRNIFINFSSSANWFVLFELPRIRY